MPMVPKGFVDQAEIVAEIEQAKRKLPPDVVHVAYSVGTDWTDDPALYFRIVLTDAASAEDRLGDVGDEVESILTENIHPLERWGLFPYFSFRSFSEQQALNDPQWS